MNKIIKINNNDNVAVALTLLNKNSSVSIDSDNILISEDIMPGHKFALTNIEKGDFIIKYGSPIGVAKDKISKGNHVHTHNISTGLGDILDYQYTPTDLNNTVPVSSLETTFNGYLRSDGKVGIRNEIWIIPTVGCVNSIASSLEKQAFQYSGTGVDDIIAFPHPYGCSQMGDDQEYTRKILADLINHPNAAGVLVLGLGCENTNIDVLKKYIGDYNTDRIAFLNCQDSDDEIKEGLILIQKLINYANTFKRQPLPVSKLTIGLKCGGSDGFSGITANPLVGRFSDLLISQGGSTILTEVPEMFGAETLLMNRCTDVDIFNKTVALINDFKQYYNDNNMVIYENPSPGNKKGGISTLEEKSLGCTQKSGTSKVNDVLMYGEILKTPGLNLLSAPGNDLVAATALAASGAQIVLFTTGRGTPFASPVPTVKISTNSSLKEKKGNWIDFDAGVLLSGHDADMLSIELYNYVLNIANGEKVCSEKNNYHDMAIFKKGVTL